jgi:hypothetical protein
MSLIIGVFLRVSRESGEDSQIITHPYRTSQLWQEAGTDLDKFGALQTRIYVQQPNIFQCFSVFLSVSQCFSVFLSVSQCFSVFLWRHQTAQVRHIFQENLDVRHRAFLH